MKTVIRNSYTPKLGDYCETIVVDRESERAFIFDQDGVFTEIPQPIDVEDILRQAAEYTDEQVAPINEKLETIEEGAQVNKIEHILKNGTELTITNKTVNVTVPTKTSDLTNDGSDGTDTYVETATLDNYYTKTETDTQIGYETTAREIADAGLQEQIDAIVASSDVVDIVGTYAALQAYDTSKLHDNDIIKVLTDETRDDATTYYRWSTSTSTWGYIGAEGPFYTKAESDAIFTPQTRTVNGKALSSDITLTAADVHALPDSTVIPTVNDGTLTIQQNGTTVQTFTANQAGNSTANITVPTKTSDLTNDGSDGTDTYVESGDLATVATTGDYDDLINKPTIPAAQIQSDWAQSDSSAVDYIKNKPTIPTQPTKTSDLTNDGDDGTHPFLATDDVATVATTGDYTDLSNLPTIPTDTSDLTNGAGFITSAALSNYYTKSETYSQQETNALINAITVPTKTSDLTNDGDDGIHAFLATDDVATVATTGDYNDLTNKPTIPTYSDFTGATASTAGVHGLVPAPAAGDEGKYLKGDGTWGTVAPANHYMVYATLYDPGPQDAARVDAPTSGVFAFTGFYRDLAKTQRISGYDLWTMVKDGHVVVSNYGNADGFIVSAIDGDEGYITGRVAINNTAKTFSYDIDFDTGVPVNTLNASYFERHQRKLKAGNNITITESTFTESGVTGYRETISASIPIDSTLDVSSSNPVENSVVTAALNGKAANTDFTGATASTAGVHGLVPAPASGDQEKVLHGDGTWKDTTAKLVEMAYGESNAWQKFIDAYNAGSIVYCRASSNADPASGAKTRKAFMAYVNNETNPTSVEFQYVRSVSSKTDAQQTDQVFVYTLKNTSGGQWSVVSRNMGPKINVDSTLNKTFTSGANATLTLGAKTMTGATSSAAGAAGYVPAPASGDDAKFLRGDGTWQTVGGGGSAVVDFYIDNTLLSPSSTTINLYKDSAKTISATVKDIYDAAMDGGARVNWFDGYYTTLSWMSVGASHDSDEDWYTTSFAETGNAFLALYFIGGGPASTRVESVYYKPLQEKLTAGTNITISNNTISATDTTYSAFTGATSSVAGSAGLVPAPTTSDPGKYLKGDGTWAALPTIPTITTTSTDPGEGGSLAADNYIFVYDAS